MKSFRQFLTEADMSSAEALKDAISKHKELTDAGVHNAPITKRNKVGISGYTHHLSHSISHADAVPVVRKTESGHGSEETTSRPDSDAYTISHHQDREDHNSTKHHVYIEHVHRDMVHNVSHTNVMRHPDFNPVGTKDTIRSSSTRYPSKVRKGHGEGSSVHEAFNAAMKDLH